MAGRAGAAQARATRRRRPTSPRAYAADPRPTTLAARAWAIYMDPARKSEGGRARSMMVDAPQDRPRLRPRPLPAGRHRPGGGRFRPRRASLPRGGARQSPAPRGLTGASPAGDAGSGRGGANTETLVLANAGLPEVSPRVRGRRRRHAGARAADSVSGSAHRCVRAPGAPRCPGGGTPPPSPPPARARGTAAPRPPGPRRGAAPACRERGTPGKRVSGLRSTSETRKALRRRDRHRRARASPAHRCHGSKFHRQAPARMAALVCGGRHVAEREPSRRPAWVSGAVPARSGVADSLTPTGSRLRHFGH